MLADTLVSSPFQSRLLIVIPVPDDYAHCSGSERLSDFSKCTQRLSGKASIPELAAGSRVLALCLPTERLFCAGHHKVLHVGFKGHSASLLG